MDSYNFEYIDGHGSQDNGENAVAQHAHALEEWDVAAQ